MAKGPFKMKGSPMQRNFGINNSPLHENKREEGSLEKQLYTKPDNWKEMTDKEKSEWVVSQQKEMLRRVEGSTGRKFGRDTDLDLYKG